jgi:glutathione S-transferase
MVLKLYGSALSGSTRRVALVLREKEVPYEFVLVDMSKAEHKTPEYLKNQPFGQVPYIDDDGFILFESRAICRYIAAKYPAQGATRTLPTDVKTKAKFEEAASVEVAHFDSHVSAYLYETLIKEKYRGLEPNEALVKGYLEKIDATLKVYEQILSNQKYIAGDELSLIDLFHLPSGAVLKRVKPEVFANTPHVAKWLETLEARPAWIPIKDGLL